MYDGFPQVHWHKTIDPWISKEVICVLTTRPMQLTRYNAFARTAFDIPFVDAFKSRLLCSIYIDIRDQYSSTVCRHTYSYILIA